MEATHITPNPRDEKLGMVNEDDDDDDYDGDGGNDDDNGSVHMINM